MVSGLKLITSPTLAPAFSRYMIVACMVDVGHGAPSSIMLKRFATSLHNAGENNASAFGCHASIPGAETFR